MKMKQHLILLLLVYIQYIYYMYIPLSPLAIHYDRDRHSIVNDISGNGGGATRNNNY